MANATTVLIVLDIRANPLRVLLRKPRKMFSIASPHLLSFEDLSRRDCRNLRLLHHRWTIKSNVPPRGFEPLTLAGPRPKRGAYASSATGAFVRVYHLWSQVEFSRQKIRSRPRLAVLQLQDMAPARTSVRKSKAVCFFDLVRPLGFEPRTISLRGSCSTN